MNLHEYQAKELLQSFHVPVPFGICLCENTDIALQKILQAFKGHKKLAVKAQIHAGGRGKGHLKENGLSGIQLVEFSQVPTAVSSMFHNTLVTKQTGEAGQCVRKVYVTECVEVQREFYLSILLDRTKQCPVLVASLQGGCEIEETAKTNPEKIVTLTIDPLLGIQTFQARKIAELFRCEANAFREGILLIKNLYRAFIELDATLIEINPLVLTKNQHFVALDAKIQLDDNACFRHPEWEKFDDSQEKDPQEIEAAACQLRNYITLDGNIACLSNGAGLCMATLDLIHHLGGKIANFLDIGDSATQEQMESALHLIFKNQKVQGVFINIFGGSFSCEMFAQSLVNIFPSLSKHLPIVVCLKGNHANEGKQILQQSGLPVFVVDNDKEAVETILKKVKEAA